MHYRHRINGDLITETTFSHLSKKDKFRRVIYISDEDFDKITKFVEENNISMWDMSVGSKVEQKPSEALVIKENEPNSELSIIQFD